MARPETLGAVLFDFDGTLCDTERHNLALVREVLVELDAPVSDEELLSIAGGDDRVVIPPILERYGSPYDIEEYERRRDGCYRTYSQAPLALEPGARELVSSLRGRGVAVALGSTTVARCALTALDRLRALTRQGGALRRICGHDAHGTAVQAGERGVGPVAVLSEAEDGPGVEHRVEDRLDGVDLAGIARHRCGKRFLRPVDGVRVLGDRRELIDGRRQVGEEVAHDLEGGLFVGDEPLNGSICSVDRLSPEPVLVQVLSSSGLDDWRAGCEELPDALDHDAEMRHDEARCTEPDGRACAYGDHGDARHVVDDVVPPRIDRQVHGLRGQDLLHAAAAAGTVEHAHHRHPHLPGQLLREDLLLMHGGIT